jgi:hypothetical protein
MMSKICKNCQYADRLQYHVRCHRYPPMMYPQKEHWSARADFVAVFPHMKMDD